MVGLYRKKKGEEEAQSGFQRESKEELKEVKVKKQWRGSNTEVGKKKKKGERQSREGVKS